MVTMLSSYWHSATVLVLVVIVSTNFSVVSSYCSDRSDLCTAINWLDREGRQFSFKERERGNDFDRSFRDSLRRTLATDHTRQEFDRVHRAELRTNTLSNLSRRDHRIPASDEQINRVRTDRFDDRHLVSRLENNLRRVDIRNENRRTLANVLREERLLDRRNRHELTREERQQERIRTERANENRLLGERDRSERVLDKRIQEYQRSREDLVDQRISENRVRGERDIRLLGTRDLKDQMQTRGDIAQRFSHDRMDNKDDIQTRRIRQVTFSREDRRHHATRSNDFIRRNLIQRTVDRRNVRFNERSHNRRDILSDRINNENRRREISADRRNEHLLERRNVRLSEDGNQRSHDRRAIVSDRLSNENRRREILAERQNQRSLERRNVRLSEDDESRQREADRRNERSMERRNVRLSEDDLQRSQDRRDILSARLSNERQRVDERRSQDRRDILSERLSSERRQSEANRRNERSLERNVRLSEDDLERSHDRRDILSDRLSNENLRREILAERQNQRSLERRNVRLSEDDESRQREADRRNEHSMERRNVRLSEDDLQRSQDRRDILSARLSNERQRVDERRFQDRRDILSERLSNERQREERRNERSLERRSVRLNEDDLQRRDILSGRISNELRQREAERRNGGSMDPRNVRLSQDDLQRSHDRRDILSERFSNEIRQRETLGERRNAQRNQDVTSRHMRQERRELQGRISETVIDNRRMDFGKIDSRTENSLRRETGLDLEQRESRFNDRLSILRNDYRRDTAFKQLIPLDSPQLTWNFCQALLIGAIVLQLLKCKNDISEYKSFNTFMNYLPLSPVKAV